MKAEAVKVVRSGDTKAAELVVKQENQVARAKADVKELEGEIAASKKEAKGVAEIMNNAIYAGGAGAVAGAAVAVFGQDWLDKKYGATSATSKWAIPAVGVVMIVVGQKALKDKKSAPGKRAAPRAAVTGAGIGMLAVGGYQTYKKIKAQPKK